MLPLLALAACVTPAAGDPRDARPPRVVVTTDPELDDANSLLRYLLYSYQFRTEGLIYASSGVHWKGDGKGTQYAGVVQEEQRFNLGLCPCTSWRWPEQARHIDDAVDAYAQAFPNLRAHHSRYPTPAALRAVIRVGNLDFPGDISRDTDGSNLIRELLLDDRPGPVYLLAWGGVSTIARALKSIQDQYEMTPQWPTIRDKVSRKAIVQSFADQDGTYANYIKPQWPAIEFREMATRTYGYAARSVVLPQDHVFLSARWTAENVLNRGPLGASYRVWGDGGQMVKDDPFDHFGFTGLSAEQLRARGYVIWTPVQEAGSWISEGDTSTFMNLIDNGLRGHEHALYGGWGGRGAKDQDPAGANPDYASARFFAAAQRDFAAHLRWAVTSRKADANHPPQVRVVGGLQRTARRGDSLALRTSLSDPDGDRVSGSWWQYREAGSYAGAVSISQVDPTRATVVVPTDALTNDTLHLIYAATDDGEPAMTRYQRLIVRVVD
jgi:hypothetical protein